MLLRRKILIIALLTAFILPQISCAPSGTTVIATAKGSTKIEQKSEKNRLDIDGKEISKYIAEGYKLCSLCGKDYSAYKAKS